MDRGRGALGIVHGERACGSTDAPFWNCVPPTRACVVSWTESLGAAHALSCAYHTQTNTSARKRRPTGTPLRRHHPQHKRAAL